MEAGFCPKLETKTRFCALVGKFVFHMDDSLELYVQTDKARAVL